jgi:cyclic pyranopterin monophosphate synthase
MSESGSSERQFTHFSESGQPKMVDVGGKSLTSRVAVAMASIRMNPETAAAIESRSLKKGDVIQVAELAGIMATKHTSVLIPLCHNIPLDNVEVECTFSSPTQLDIVVTVRSFGKTGVEMEALTGASVAALTVYDMCKSMDKGMEIQNVKLLRKRGGTSGDFERQLAD